jgi:uncharacterized protein involved in outer membrane biogenesis
MKLIKLIASLLFLAVIFCIFAFKNIFESYLERQAGHLLNVPLQIGSINVSNYMQDLTLHGVKIKNPPAFTKFTDAMNVDSMTIKVDARTIFSNTFKIKSIEIINPVLSVEQNADGINWFDIVKSDDDNGEKQGAAGKKKAKRQVVVESLVIKNKTINADVMGEEHHLVVPLISLQQVNLSELDQDRVLEVVRNQIVYQVIEEKLKERLQRTITKKLKSFEEKTLMPAFEKLKKKIDKSVSALDQGASEKEVNSN